MKAKNKIINTCLILILISSLTFAKSIINESETLAAISGENLFLLGTFDDYTADYVIEILENNSNVTRVVLTANGGSINDKETLRLGRYIRAKGLDTHIIANGVATSGGVSLFLAGKNRSVGSGAFLGVHSWAQCPGPGGSECKPATEFDNKDIAHNLHLDYTIEMLGNGDFYWFSINSAPHNSIHWLTNDELLRFDITNHQIDLSIIIPFEQEFLNEYELTCHNCPE